MIHWEQSYNCEGSKEMYEQFIRQALTMPNRPIVIFSHSATENWRKDSCAEMPRPHMLTEDEKTLLKVLHQHRPLEIFTSINSISHHFSIVKDLDVMYKVRVSVQHSSYL